MATYLFSGFTESDLVSTDSIDMGQSFTVPAAPTHSFQVEDDDARMSGDTVTEGTSDDRSQTVSIRRGSSNAGSGHVYLDEVYTLQDEAGHQYTMYELEVEGTGEDFYVFQDPPPAPGTHLTVVRIEDATAGEVTYDEFAGDDGFDENDRDVSTIYGGAGDDTITHRGGNDTIYGGTGNDTLTGSDGEDLIYGGAGQDTIRGDGGADRIYGGAGDDWIDGGNQSDQLYAGAGDDHVEGDKGNDTFYGGHGADTLYGGEGDDLFVFEDGFGNDVIDGGTSSFHIDTDRIDLTGLSQGVEITYTDAESGTIRQGSSTATFEEIEEIDASEQSDVIDASALSSGMTISGNGGDDTIAGGAGDDSLSGGTGDDTLSGGAGNDTLEGDAGADRLDGGAGDDTIDLGAQSGEADTVVLSDGGGNDVVLNFEAPVENDDGTRSGRDQIDVTGLHDADGNPVNIRDVTVTAAPDDPADAILSFPNGESLRLVGVSAASVDSPRALIAMGIPASDGTVRGTEGDDVMTPGWEDDDGDRIDSGDAFYNGTTSDQDIIAAGAGDDQVQAGAENDEVYGGTGRDTIHGDAGNDRIYGEADDDTLYGGTGNDRAYGGTGHDTIHGDAGHDRLYGGAGDDSLYGDAGNDWIYGGTGNDHIETGAGSDTVLGGAGDDVVDDRADTETASRNIVLGEEGHDTIMMGAATDWVDAGAGNDTVWGGAGDDLLYGDSGDDVVEGGAGDDEIAGGHGSDTVHGGEGDDVIATGGTTDDGIAAHDTAYGGGGDDLFMPSADFDDATILGGETGEVEGDTIDLGASHHFAHGVTYASPERDYTLDLSDADAESGTITDGTGTWTFSEIENLRLGSGTETLRLANGSGDDRVIGFEAPTQEADGSYTGHDLIDVSDMTDADGFRLNTDDVTVTDDGMGNARLAFPGGETLTLVGVAPAEVSDPAAMAAMGIPRPDGTIEGSAGDDVIDAGYMGDPEGERVDGGDSVTTPGGDDDLIMAGAGNDKVMAGAGGDEAHGGTGDDTLFGGAGDDTLHGEAGNDRLRGDAGDDALFGGLGSDRFELTDGFGSDTIDGGEDPADDDRDVIDAGALSSGIDVTYTGDESGSLASGTDNASFQNIEAIEGSAQADRMDAGASRSGTTLSGGGGDDRITGGAGDDTLTGGAGHDTITGGRGSDRIEGGAGDDEIHIAHGDAATGGAGDDLFLFDDEGETDTTVTGGDGFDTLDLRSASRLETLSMTEGPEGWSGSVLMDNGSTMRFSQMERVICFTAGTRIATPFGPRRAEDLAVGDLVLTRDHGPQPLRWTGSRRAA
ncbi:Hint domain-containing protein, partial [Limimaricola litoreus]